MFAKKAKQRKERNILAGLAIGAMIGEIIVITGAAIVSGLILRDTLSTDAIGFTACTILFAAALLGSVFISKYIGSKQLICCGLFALVFTILNLALGMLFFNGISSRVWMTIVSIVSGAGICCALNMLPKKKNQYRFAHNG